MIIFSFLFSHSLTLTHTHSHSLTHTHSHSLTLLHSRLSLSFTLIHVTHTHSHLLTSNLQRLIRRPPQHWKHRGPCTSKSWRRRPLTVSSRISSKGRSRPSNRLKWLFPFWVRSHRILLALKIKNEREKEEDRKSSKREQTMLTQMTWKDMYPLIHCGRTRMRRSWLQCGRTWRDTCSRKYTKGISYHNKIYLFIFLLFLYFCIFVTFELI